MTHAVKINLGLLIAILVHNLAYPLSATGGVWPALFYLFYGSMFVVAVFALSALFAVKRLMALIGLAVITAGLVNSYAPSSVAALAVFGTSVLYHLLMIGVLALYTFRAGAVTTDILLSATSLYLVIGSGFAAVYSLTEWLAPGSFTTASGGAAGWQDFLYFSYVTLTTLGYGDILPVGFYAQSIVTFEAVGGTLYTVILLSRLVGMYASGDKSA